MKIVVALLSQANEAVVVSMAGEPARSLPLKELHGDALFVITDVSKSHLQREYPRSGFQPDDVIGVSILEIAKRFGLLIYENTKSDLPLLSAICNRVYRIALQKNLINGFDQSISGAIAQHFKTECSQAQSKLAQPQHIQDALKVSPAYHTYIGKSGVQGVTLFDVEAPRKQYLEHLVGAQYPNGPFTLESTNKRQNNTARRKERLNDLFEVLQDQGEIAICYMQIAQVPPSLYLPKMDGQSWSGWCPLSMALYLSDSVELIITDIYKAPKTSSLQQHIQMVPSSVAAELSMSYNLFYGINVEQLFAQAQQVNPALHFFLYWYDIMFCIDKYRRLQENGVPVRRIGLGRLTLQLESFTLNSIEPLMTKEHLVLPMLLPEVEL